MNKQIPPSRVANDIARGRQHLLPEEIQSIIETIRESNGRYKIRDELMVVMAYHHGLRPGELLNIRWEHINLRTYQIDIERLKSGIDSTHIITSTSELELLKAYNKLQACVLTGPVFLTERKSVMLRHTFNKMMNTYSLTALGCKWHPSALRHACGYALAARGVPLRTAQLYMGLRNIQHVAKYY